MYGIFMVCAIMQACVYVYYNLFISTMIFASNFMAATTFSGKVKSHPIWKQRWGQVSEWKLSRK